MNITASASAFSTGVTAMGAGQQRVEQAAQEIASGISGQSATTASLTDIAAQQVEMIAGRIEVEAAAKVVESAEQALGTLLDIRA